MIWAAVIAALATLLSGVALLRSRARCKKLEQDLGRLRAGRSFADYGTWDWVVHTDELHWSDEVYAMFGFAPGEIVPTYSLFCSMVHPEDSRRVREGEIRCIEGEARHDEEYRIILRDGSLRWLRETGNVMRDDAGRPVRMIGMVRDVTEEKLREQALLHQAFHDGLTGLPNRVHFRNLLAEALGRAARNDGTVALVFIDLNGFKPLNDSYGHAFGDKVLARIAETLRATLRSGDHAARLGGDEFVAVLEGLNKPEDVRAALDKLQAALGRPMTVEGRSIRMGAALGAALYPLHADNAEDLMERADQAMYTAKYDPGKPRLYGDS